MVVVAAGTAYYVSGQLKPVSPASQEIERFVIAKGSSGRAVAEKLAQTGLIKDPLIFRYYLQIQGYTSQIKPGSYELSASMSAAEIADTLTKGTQDIWVTLLEGWRAEEMAAYLEKQELQAFDADEFLQLAASSEGKLYPDTYLVPKDITAQTMHRLLLNTFEVRVNQGLSDEIEASSRSFSDVLIMASLIEREARDYEQMRHVSGILWNRIRIGMPLQVDATLQYAKGYNPSTQAWWSTPLAADKTIQSPFNTYLNAGLPPRPIANPSLLAIQAALDPLPVNDLFYLHASDGKMYYAETNEGHNANVSRYLR